MNMSPLSIEFLAAHSGLPGPRGNLELLDRFANQATFEQVRACLAILQDDTANSPEEFVGMCGVLGYAVLHQNDLPLVFFHLEHYMSHSSWRIRETTAIAIQKLGFGRLDALFGFMEKFAVGNPYEQRAVVAGLCEPRLLDRPDWNLRVLSLVGQITDSLDHDRSLTEGEVSLRKALGYGWSVVVAKTGEQGKTIFEGLLQRQGKHVCWIVRENLKKNRLIRLDEAWVKKLATRLEPLSL